MSELPAVSVADQPAASARRSFARGLTVALPLSLGAWLVFFWLI